MRLLLRPTSTKKWLKQFNITRACLIHNYFVEKWSNKTKLYGRGRYNISQLLDKFGICANIFKSQCLLNEIIFLPGYFPLFLSHIYVKTIKCNFQLPAKQNRIPGDFTFVCESFVGRHIGRQSLSPIASDRKSLWITCIS